MHSLTKELADIFAEESENDRTFYGFSDNEKSDFSKVCDSAIPFIGSFVHMRYIISAIF